MSKISTERLPAIQRWLVRGTLAFPIDMLRYDRCWPAQESDSNVIRATIAHENGAAVEVVVYARRELTAGRWASFGWTVVRNLGADI